MVLLNRSVHVIHMPTQRRAPPRKAPALPRWHPSYLRQWRLHADRSLESVAAKMGITHGQLSRIERGLSPYSQNILEIAAIEYKCTVQDILTRAPDEADSVFSMWGKLDDGQRRQAQRLFEALVKDE